MKIERETYMRSEWVITFGELQIPLHSTLIIIFIVIGGLISAQLGEIVAQNQIMFFEEYRLAHPECSIIYDLGYMNIDCGTPRTDLSPLHFELPKNYSIIND